MELSSAKSAFLFDLDGVLIDTEDSYSDFWETIRTEFVKDYPDFCERIKGNTIDFILEHYIMECDRVIVRERFYKFERSLNYKFYPRALDVVKQVKSKGYKVALVTASDAVKMTAFCSQSPVLFDICDYVLTAGDMTVSKPAPDCWWLAAKELGVSIKECVILEDSINGLKSAHSSGGYVIGVATGLPREVVAHYSDIVINQISELYE